MNLDFNDGYVAFKKAVNICDLEKSFVRLATYLYKQHLTETEPDDTAVKRHIQFDAAQNFSKSLLYGTKHIYQSMPCILTLWLDFGARVATQLRANRPTEVLNEMVKMLVNFNRLIENNTFLLPTYMFMTAFSQILSRINHRHPVCLEILSKIIIKILKEYPQQAMWSFYSVCRSTDVTQRERTAEIYKRFRGSDKEGGRFLKAFTNLAERLIDISMKKLRSDVRQVNLNQISPKLQLMMEEIRNAPIMLPLQKFLTVRIAMRRTGDEPNEQHTPFPLNPIYITDVKSAVLILISIQMPKRLEFVGSDGQTYPLMCKQDDLRLDSRFMEFNSVINTLLRTDSDACEKNLSIRTYSVVPLNSECGIIEWLNGLSSLKSVIVDMYAKLNIQTMPVRQVKKLMYVEKDQVPLQERLRRFVAEILPQHPPVLHKWFFERHPCPEEWLHCRNAFVRSSAVMSIVGYIVGLGDRHCENILIDSATGEAVHVDFNMLFNRSDILKFPETVPFRLTHSMVRAMGATGVEGLFVNSAETTARVVRHNSEQLLSVLKPFLYDIDVKSYNPRRHALKKSAALVTDDMLNDEAKINIQNVEMRLSGVVRCKNNQWAQHRDSKPLSVEGQTRMLIKEATSDLNLCQMFVGWSPYL
ncbi:unnamed protein product [Nesidiocoris tenuis]|uniref:Serine/threonine-protein kinase ATR n=1 Tax=Nesidiocoris tenuis TaxID=355587 RepID=A0A6H5H4V7_9HEMI|nr:unnamed protein product [Nesidiocoris tenuis]